MTKSILFVLDLDEVGFNDVALVGGKGASLGELLRASVSRGVRAVEGFAITSAGYRQLLATDELGERLREMLAGLNSGDLNSLQAVGRGARALMLDTPLPPQVTEAILEAYERLCHKGRVCEVAVRSSATAEDLPEASFAGQQDTILNVRGEKQLIEACHRCFASLWTDRAISYRETQGFDHFEVALSICVQPMVRSDLACSGVMFTLDTESGFRDVVVINAAWGLGEAIVQGMTTPDEWVVFKRTLRKGAPSIISRRLGSKEVKMVYGLDERGTRMREVVEPQRRRFVLDDYEVLKLAEWARLIEEHYSKRAGHDQPMDIEWAKDGRTGEFYILQARPETVHATSRDNYVETYRLVGERPPRALATGQAVGEKIGRGRVHMLTDPDRLADFAEGDVLVTSMTDPSWEPIMKRAAAIITDRGGRTCHSAIISRELGLPCVVGTGNATRKLETGMEVTVSCAEGALGNVYEGLIEFAVERRAISQGQRPNTQVMMNVGDPDQAFSLSFLPNDGVGLARLEFIITNHIGIHPMALVRYPSLERQEDVREIERRIGEEEPRDFFIRCLAEGVGRIAAAFYPKPVIVRMSDFKSNEYARLIGGREFEPVEENPMLGFRGASRYYDDRYREGFGLECKALERVREEMGLTNVKAMIPFCRTVEEAKRVIQLMAEYGLRQGEQGLEIYAMCELPANVIYADEFLSIFDGYSIGSNDLTQLALGVDRDSEMVAHLFDERNGAVERMVEMAIEAAHRAGKKIGICGQAPSDYPEFACFLVERGITSISLNPDTVIQTTQVISEAEAQLSNVPREPPEGSKLTKISATETSHRSCDQNKVLAQQ